jgi:hypothetical protein
MVFVLQLIRVVQLGINKMEDVLHAIMDLLYKMELVLLFHLHQPQQLTLIFIVLEQIQQVHVLDVSLDLL